MVKSDLTIEELAKELGRSENSILKNYKRTKENLAKKGIFISRSGTGKNAKYKIEYNYED